MFLDKMSSNNCLCPLFAVGICDHGDCDGWVSFENIISHLTSSGYSMSLAIKYLNKSWEQNSSTVVAYSSSNIITTSYFDPTSNHSNTDSTELMSTEVGVPTLNSSISPTSSNPNELQYLEEEVSVDSGVITNEQNNMSAEQKSFSKRKYSDSLNDLSAVDASTDVVRSTKRHASLATSQRAHNVNKLSSNATNSNSSSSSLVNASRSSNSKGLVSEETLIDRAVR